jgi:hypothetical protein
MESKITSTKRSCRSKLVCRICGDVARGMNFDVLTCMSCKAFFRRNALRYTVTCLYQIGYYILSTFNRENVAVHAEISAT